MLLHKIFESQREKHPNHIAIQFEDESPLTYQELDSLANQIAHYLIKLGIKSQDKVAVRVKRSIEQVAVLLAIFKIGAIYVPIAPPNPSTEIDSVGNVLDILNDVQPTCLIGHSDIIMEFKNIEKRVDLDVEKFGIAEQQTTKPNNSALTPQQTAYIIYSSGTTGKPKGIPIKHAGLAYWAKVQKNLFTHITAESKILGFISIGFDAHIWEYLMAWVKGASIRLASEKTCLDPIVLTQFMQSHQITDATFVPSVLRSLNLEETLPLLKTKGLQSIYSTGEKCTRDIVENCEKNHIDLWNCYGPTEATFGVSVSKIHLSNLNPDDRVPIGRPFGKKVKIHILNENLQFISENEIGELYIQSPYLTPGYLNRPEETKKNFITILINKNPVRLYKTQDKVQLYNGLIYYYGRISEIAPIKINGQLVNPLAIEDFIRQQKNIEDVCVVVKEENSNNPYLVAYLVLKKNLPFDEMKLRQALNFNLKQMSIPANFVLLKKLPKTINGKVNRRLLTDQSINRNKINDNTIELIASPRNSLEQQILTFWQQVLGFNGFSITDSFANLGGNSTHLMTLVGKLNQLESINIPIWRLFPLENLTIEKLANIIYEEQNIQKMNSRIIEKIRDGEKNKLPLFFIPPITGEGSYTYTALVSAINEKQTCYAFNAPGLLNATNISTSIESIAKVYIAAMRLKQPNGPYYLLSWSFGCTVTWEMVKQLEADGEEIAFVGLIDGVSPELMSKLDNPSFNIHLLELITDLCQILNSAPYQTGLTLPTEQIKRLQNLDHDHQVIKAFSLLKTTSVEAQRLLEITKNHLLASNHYCTQSFETIQPIIVFSCVATQKKVKQMIPGDLTAITALGWNLSGQQIIINSNTLAGDHFSIIRQPDELARSVRICLNNNKKKKTHSQCINPLLLNEHEELKNTVRKQSEQLEEQSKKLDELLAQQQQLLFLLFQEHSPPKDSFFDSVPPLPRLKSDLFNQRNNFSLSNDDFNFASDKNKTNVVTDQTHFLT